MLQQQLMNPLSAFSSLQQKPASAPTNPLLAGHTTAFGSSFSLTVPSPATTQDDWLRKSSMLLHNQLQEHIDSHHKLAESKVKINEDYARAVAANGDDQTTAYLKCVSSCSGDCDVKGLCVENSCSNANCAGECRPNGECAVQTCMDAYWMQTSTVMQRAGTCEGKCATVDDKSFCQYDFRKHAKLSADKPCTELNCPGTCISLPGRGDELVCSVNTCSEHNCLVGKCVMGRCVKQTCNSKTCKGTCRGDGKCVTNFGAEEKSKDRQAEFEQKMQMTVRRLRR